jgi:hypothetical protein
LAGDGHEPIGGGAASSRAFFGTTGKLAVQLVAPFFAAFGHTDLEG